MHPMDENPYRSPSASSDGMAARGKRGKRHRVSLVDVFVTITVFVMLLGVLGRPTAASVVFAALASLLLLVLKRLLRI
jgi:hypothetical protein